VTGEYPSGILKAALSAFFLKGLKGNFFGVSEGPLTYKYYEYKWVD
jgi:hypothetical protein